MGRDGGLPAAAAGLRGLTRGWTEDGAWPGRGGAGRALAWERGAGSRLEGALQGRLAELLGESRLLTVTPRRRDGMAPSAERRWRHVGVCRATRKLVSKKEGPTPGRFDGGKSGRSRGLGYSACPFPELVIKGGSEKRVNRVGWGRREGALSWDPGGREDVCGASLRRLGVQSASPVAGRRPGSWGRGEAAHCLPLGLRKLLEELNCLQPVWEGGAVRCRLLSYRALVGTAQGCLGKLVRLPGPSTGLAGACPLCFVCSLELLSQFPGLHLEQEEE